MSSDGIGKDGLSFEDFLSGRRESAEAPGRGTAIVPPAAADEGERERIVANLRRILTHQLRSETCTVLPAGTTVRASGNVGEVTYRPDLVVDAQEWDGHATEARQPLAIFEVAAAGSERADFIGKWQIHRSLPTVGVHVLVDPEGVVVTIQRRKADAWKEEVLAEQDDQIFLPTLHALVPLAEVYSDAPPAADGSVEFGNVILS